MSSNSSSGAGIGLFTAAFIVLAVLKLSETGVVAEWSWWWVTAPLWGPWVAVAAVAIVVGLCAIPWFAFWWAYDRHKRGW